MDNRELRQGISMTPVWLRTRWRSLKPAGAEQVVPVSLAHSGWVAVELRRRLGSRIPKIVLLEWLVLEPPQHFLEALHGMQSPDRWRETVE
jgi:hypothetical protein